MKTNTCDCRAPCNLRVHSPWSVRMLLCRQSKGEADPKQVGPEAEGQEDETLEAKVRKSRPPPRVRISSSSQPGYVSLRLDGVAVTFRNQEVIKDATWEVKTGDRLGLVGPNGGSVSPVVAAAFPSSMHRSSRVVVMPFISDPYTRLRDRRHIDVVPSHALIWINN